MLLILTGNVQIGKTRWLQRCVSRLEEAGVACHGVLAPGTWKETDQGLEKTGIDNLLLPSHKVVPFARRNDLAKRDGAFDPNNQAARANLKWHISDDAVARVNAHFARLRSANEQAISGSRTRGQGKRAASCAAYDSLAPDRSQEHAGSRPRHDVFEANDIRTESSLAGESATARSGTESHAVLFVDELGQLELLREEGLTEAMALLAQGPQGIYKHAVVVARNAFGLPGRASALFSHAWGGSREIRPAEEAWRTWLAPLVRQKHDADRPS